MKYAGVLLQQELGSLLVINLCSYNCFTPWKHDQVTGTAGLDMVVKTKNMCLCGP